jgi:hypothetical protein
MLKNVASQRIGAQMVSATDGSAFTGAVTVSVTVDAGVQATGSVGAGACTHEGNGYHTYAPAQAETNGDLVAFTFTGSGAVPATVQVYTMPTTGILAPGTLGHTLTLNGSGKVSGVVLADTVTTYTGNTVQTGDAFARLGAPAGVSVSADIAAIEAQTDDIGVAGAGLTAVPWNAAWDAEVQSEVADALAVYDPPTKAELDSAVAPLALEATAQSILTDTAEIGAAGAGLTNINLPNQTMDIVGNITGNLSGSVGSVTGNVGGNVVGTAQLDLNQSTTGVFLSQTLGDAFQTIDASLDSDGVVISSTTRDDIVDRVWNEAQSGHTTAGTFGKYLDDEVSQVGGGSAPTAAVIADAVWDELLAGHAIAGSAGAGLSAAGSAGDPWSTLLPGAYADGTAGDIIGNIIEDMEGAFPSSSITVTTNFNDESEELNVKRTDDYTSNTDQEITFNAIDFPEFPADSVYFRASRNGVLLFAEVLCETAVVNGTTQSVTLELTRDQVVLMNYGAVDDYRFRATYVENTAPPEDPDNGEYRTVRWGKLNVERVGA